MRLLLDEMYASVVACELLDRGHDVLSIHDPEYRRLEGAPDAEVYAAAVTDSRTLVTENVFDFRRLEAATLASGEPHAGLIITSNRQFPRGAPAAIGRLVVALDAFLKSEPEKATTVFLQHTD